MVNTETFQRMLEEFKGLTERIDKCRSFILDETKFQELDMLNRDLLISQLKAMEAYQSVLSIRLGLNAPEKAEAPEEDTPEVVDELNQ